MLPAYTNGAKKAQRGFGEGSAVPLVLIIPFRDGTVIGEADTATSTKSAAEYWALLSP